MAILAAGALPGAVATGSVATAFGKAVTTTRASTRYCATTDGGFTALSSNQPCVEGAGLLSEPATTNLLTAPLDFSNAAWTQNQILSAVQGDALCNPAPDGSNNAWKITPTVASTDAYVLQTLGSNTTQAPFVGSLWVRMPTAGTLNTNILVYFTVDANTSPANQLSPHWAYQWTRIFAPLDLTSSPHTGMRLFFGAGTSWTNAIGPLCFWGPALRQEAYPSSFHDSARAADVHSVANPLLGKTSWCVNGVFTPAGAGVAWRDVLNAVSIGGRSWSSAQTLWDIGTDAAANSARLRTDASGNVILDVYDGTGTVKTITTTASPAFGIGSPHRIRVCDDAGGGLTMQLDGTAAAVTGSGAGTGIITTQPASFFPGASGNAAGSWTDLCLGVPLTCTGTGVPYSQAALLGDSITYGFNTTQNYPWDLMNVESGLKVHTFNYGVNGDHVAQILTRWSGGIRATKPQHLVYMGGVNDLIAGTSAATVWTSIQTVADQARADGDTVHLLTVLPFAGDDPTPAHQTERATLNASILSYCTTNGLRCVDAYSAFNDSGNPTHMLAAYDSGDGLHPNNAGAQKLADLVRAVLP